MGKGLAGRKIVVGVTGSIAAFKVAGWVSSLAKSEARLSVIMTEAAQRFITPLTFSALTGEQAYTSMFDEIQGRAMSHIELAQEADVFLIAPATAKTIASLARGMADDLLGTAVLATRAPVVVCPAMNPKMYLHQATQDNIRRLRELGYHVMEPDCGSMACGDEGPGRLVEWESARELLLRCLSVQDLRGEKVLITAGPTREAIDPARFISNRSSGRMGHALARAAYRRGAEVVLVSGPTPLTNPYGVRTIAVVSAQEMHDAVLREFEQATIIIKSAAVSDFRPAVTFERKVKKEDAADTIDIVRNPDILLEVGRMKKPAQIVVGFAAESHNLEEEAKRKLQHKNLDVIAVNDITAADSGFEVDTNRITLVDATGSKRLPLATKEDTADMILEYISRHFLRGRTSQPSGQKVVSC